MRCFVRSIIIAASALVAITSVSALAGGALDPCRWSLDGSFTSTLFLRLYTRPNPLAGESYLQSSKFVLNETSPESAMLAIMDPGGKNIGYIHVHRETFLMDAQGKGDLPGFSFDIYIKPEHESSGFGSLLMLYMANHLEQRSSKLRPPVEFSEKAAKSFERLEAARLVKRITARKKNGENVQVWEFDLSGISDADRADLGSLPVPGIAAWPGTLSGL